ncbi:hypothetical protein PHJA_000209600 [Phtheirospermum japonicum]|uniref:Gag protein n=1 Tax=Phtheirospermum japonicum TaxID=374723 RepID=A0A830B838_9LAMI|nr:hypothetical protein PHJA_000209600 [Phtheirospermum japonicum]
MMRAYIKTMDERSRRAILTSLEATWRDDPYGDIILKNEIDWTVEILATSNANTKALNAIYSFVDVSLLRIISNIQMAKEAWEALQLFCEGSRGVQRTKLRMLETQFKVMRMDKSEVIANYSAKLLDISNECQSLGSPISNERLVSKFLRSVTEKFNVKITAIEEAKDTSVMSFDELVGSLKAHEMELKIKQPKWKSIALISAPDSEDEDLDLAAIAYEAEYENLDADGIALITRKFGDFLKKKNISRKPLNRHLKSASEPSTPQLMGQSFNRFQRRDSTPMSAKSEPRNQNSTKDLDNVQCHECRGFGRYKYECDNTLRKKNFIAMSDGEDDEEPKETEVVAANENMDNIVCFNSVTITESDENEDFATTYEELYGNRCKLL